MPSTNSGVKAARKIQFGNESVMGTRVLADTIWRGTGGLKDDRNVVFPEEDVGYISGTDRSYIAWKGGTLTLDPIAANFEQLPQILTSAIKAVTTGVADGGGSGKVYQYTAPMTQAEADAVVITTKSFEVGDNQEVEFCDYGYVRNFKLSGAQKQPWLVSAEFGTRAVDVNDLFQSATITCATADNSFSDSGNGLAIFSANMGLKVIGSTYNDGIYTVSSASADKVIVTTALPASETPASVTLKQHFTPAATLPAVEEMLFGMSKLYIDAIGGTIGTSQKSNTLYAATLNYDTGIVEKFLGDGRLDFSFFAMTKPSVKLDLTFEHNGSANVEKEMWRSQTARLLQIKCEGSTLTTGATYTKKSMIINLCGKWEDFKVLGDENGNDIIQGTFRAAYDSTGGKFAEIIVVNELSALP